MVKNYTIAGICKEFPRTFFRGIGQVMFQDNAWSGFLIMCGIIWGAIEEGMWIVALGMVIGTIVSTLAGYILGLSDENGAQGLWGFNGCLVGCALPTFLGNTIWMWIALIICSALTTWVRTGMNRILGKVGQSSFTFPFVLCTWFFLLAARLMHGMPPTYLGDPSLPAETVGVLDMSLPNLIIYWLKGIAQVFLINSWVTGIFFLAGLAVSSLRAAIWCAISSAIALLVAILWQAPSTDIANGLYGFSAVLTGIALGATFCNFSWKSTIWTVTGVIVTVFVQAGMNTLFAPMGFPTLTGPFCIATWMFLLPGYTMFAPKSK